MIIKATTHNHAGNLARYLLTPKPGEKEFVMELRDAATDDLKKALTDWEAIAQSKTKGSNFLYHAHIRLRDGEALKEAQWHSVIEQLETKLGFTNSARAIVGHNDPEKGLHLHIVWSRLDPVTGKLASLSNDRKHHHAIARAAEKEFGLEPVPEKPRGPNSDRKQRRLSDREIRALKDRGINQEKLEKIVRAACSACDGGQEMKAMLGALGVEIQAGDRRDWVVEYKGLKMNPVRLLEDVNTAQFRERMKDVDHEKEKQKVKDAAPAMHGKRAAHTIRAVLDKQLANDMERPTAKTGFRQRRHQGPQPKLKRKMWFGDPGI